MNRQQLTEDFKLVNHAFIKAIGREPVLSRPPYGAYDDNVLTVVNEFEQQVVMWSVDPRDWDNVTPAQIAQRVLTGVDDGTIILLHEGRESTLVALPIIIESLHKNGYQLVTVSELFNGE